MVISEKRFYQIWSLEAGAAQVNQHSGLNTEQLNCYRQGLQAAIDIMNANSDEEAAKVAADIRKLWAGKTCTRQEHWAVGEIVPDANWIVK